MLELPTIQQRADSFTARAHELEAALATMEIMRIRNPPLRHKLKEEHRHCLREAARLTREANE